MHTSYLVFFFRESEYACQSGQCIDAATTCDGIQDCSDGSDETQVLCEPTPWVDWDS